MITDAVLKLSLLCCIIDRSTSVPFLYSAPSALINFASSASASASQPSSPVSNIANLRRKQEKAEKLQEEENESDGGQEAHDSDVGSENNNEASPSILQKKVSKILTKLKLIAQIKNTVHPKPNTENNEDDKQDSEKEVTTEAKTEENDSDKKTNNKEENPVNNVTNESNTIKSENLKETSADYNDKSKIDMRYYGIPKILYNKPQRINLDVNGKFSNEKSTENLVNDGTSSSEDIKDNGKFGQIGIFFTELFGMLVGLAYGAAAQISHAQNQSTGGPELL